MGSAVQVSHQHNIWIMAEHPERLLVAFLSVEQDKLTEILWLIACAREEINPVDTLTGVVLFKTD